MSDSGPQKSRRLLPKIALVLGAGSVGPGWGNGKACAVAYSRAGAKVAAADLVLERAQETCSIIAAEDGTAVAMAGDVSRSGDIKRIVDETLDAYGRIDILHNNVGISLAGGAIDLSEPDWDRSIDCNLKSVFLACKYVLPVMQKQGSGVITNISSILSVRISRYDEIAYYASKAGVDQITRAIAVKHASQGIRCNAIQPGLINTPLLYENEEVVIDSHGSVAAMIEDRNAASPTGKMGEAWDIANAAVFLASDEAGYINGVVLPVDGAVIWKQAT